MTFTEDEVLTGPGIPEGLEWLYSEKEQVRMLKEIGLKTSAPNIKGWTTLERIPPKPMFPHSPFERTRKDNAKEPEDKLTDEMVRRANRPAIQVGLTITIIERAKIQKHYADAILPRYRRDATRPE